MNTTDSAHLLVVDDDARLRSLLHRFLTQQGFLVTTAADAAEARALIKSIDFDCLILDVMMPGENGFDLASDLRAQSDLPILMLTARGESADRITGLERGADDYLPKPFEPRELMLRAIRPCAPLARQAPAAAPRDQDGRLPVRSRARRAYPRRQAR